MEAEDITIGDGPSRGRTGGPGRAILAPMLAARTVALVAAAFATAVAATLLAPRSARAQELEPGLYHSAPIGLNAAMLAYTFQTGNLLFDTALRIEGARGDVHSATFGYVRTFALFGKTAKLDLQVPAVSADYEGLVDGVPRTRSPSGFADPRVRFLVNFVGAPALRRPDFAAYRPGTIAGASVQVIAPLGDYDASKLLNLGSNRWSFRPEIGLSHARGRWFLGFAAGAWLFTDNTDFFGGSTLSQEPLPFVKGDLMYTTRRRLWLSLSYGLGTGGETSVDGRPSAEIQTNHRASFTVAYPFGRSMQIKGVYTNGLSTHLGADFDSYGAAFQYSWGG